MNVKHLERTGHDRDAFYREPRPDYVELAEYTMAGEETPNVLPFKRRGVKRWRMDIRNEPIGAIPIGRLMDRMEVDLWLDKLERSKGPTRERMLRERPIVEVKK